jgi:phosphate acetyltransferase
LRNHADPPGELAAIAVASADSQSLADEPRVALLSPTHGSPPQVDRCWRALARGGPISPSRRAAGTAVTPAVAARRYAEERRGGRAKLIFPDLDSGNIAYKLVQHLGGATAIGPFLQGFAKPISDLSRGATSTTSSPPLPSRWRVPFRDYLRFFLPAKNAVMAACGSPVL